MKAIVRDVPASLGRALRRTEPSSPIDVARAARQHEAYVEALMRAGADVIALEADEALPDCCFVEDCAVRAGGTTLVTRPGAPERRAEVDAIAAVAGRHGPVVTMQEPATLDGGDCLRVGRSIYVGLSQRTSAEGAGVLAAVFGPLGYEVVTVEVGDALHLKSVCSALGDERVLLAEGTIPAAAFSGHPVVLVPRAEELGANVVIVGRRALVQARHPAALHAVSAAGFDAIEVDTSELYKADGALTCLSILIDP